MHPLAPALEVSLREQPKQAFTMLSLCKQTGFPYTEGTTKICSVFFLAFRMMEKLCYNSEIKTWLTLSGSQKWTCIISPAHH